MIIDTGWWSEHNGPSTWYSDALGDVGQLQQAWNQESILDTTHALQKWTCSWGKWIRIIKAVNMVANKYHCIYRTLSFCFRMYYYGWQSKHTRGVGGMNIGINYWNGSRYIQLKNDNETITQSMVNYMASWFSGPASKATTVDLDAIEAAADL